MVGFVVLLGELEELDVLEVVLWVDEVVLWEDEVVL